MTMVRSLLCALAAGAARWAEVVAKAGIKPD
jgi:hypothetical protein